MQGNKDKTTFKILTYSENLMFSLLSALFR